MTIKRNPPELEIFLAAVHQRANLVAAMKDATWVVVDAGTAAGRLAPTVTNAPGGEELEKSLAWVRRCARNLADLMQRIADFDAGRVPIVGSGGMQHSPGITAAELDALELQLNAERS